MKWTAEECKLAGEHIAALEKFLLTLQKPPITFGKKAIIDSVEESIRVTRALLDNNCVPFPK
jgi:hypothetical protein